MTCEQIEKKVIELIHQEPFVPFQLEMSNGEVVVVPHPRLVINGGGAGFIDPDGALVDIDFAKVRSIGTLPRIGV